MFEAARVLNADDYDTTSQPYLVEQVAAAVLAEFKRNREPRGPVSEPVKIDPVALKQREEAEALRLQAVKTLKDAQAKAEALAAESGKRSVEDAAKAKEAAHQEGMALGRAAGFETGEKKGKEEGLAAYAESLARMQSLLESAKAEKDAYFNDREALLVELVTKVSAKVIHREVATRNDHIQNLLRQVVQKLADKSKLQVFLKTEDLERMTQAQADGLLKLQGVKQIEFLADDKMVEGGLRIASGYQTLDAALDSQLAEICRGLLEEAYHDKA